MKRRTTSTNLERPVASSEGVIQRTLPTWLSHWRSQRMGSGRRIERSSRWEASWCTGRPISFASPCQAQGANNRTRDMDWEATHTSSLPVGSIPIAPRWGGGRNRSARKRRARRRRQIRVGKTPASAHRFLHERADPCLFGGSQLLQREGDRPQGAFVEVRRVAEAERRVPRAELLRALEEADDFAVLGIRGHPVPGFRREGRRAGLDDRVEPLGHSAIRFRHLGDLREHVAFPVRLVRARATARGRLQLLGALLHRGSFLIRASLDLLVARGGALGRLRRVLRWAHRNLLILTWVGSLAAVRVRNQPCPSMP